MSSQITQAVQDKLKLHLALFSLLTFLLKDFDITRIDEVPVTRIFVIVWVGLLMTWAFIIDYKRPNRDARNVIERARLLSLELDKLLETEKVDKKQVLDDLKERIEALSMENVKAEEEIEEGEGE